MHIVHQLEEARTALRAGATELVTPDGAACKAGVGYWQAMQQLLAQEFAKQDFTLWVCCGDNAAVAHDALRLGMHIRFNGNPAVSAKLETIANKQGVKMLDKQAA